MRRALVVGIDEYSSSPLYGCCNDARAVADILNKNEDGSPNFDVRTEFNVSQKGRLMEMIIDCFSTDADIALFYYSGHGVVDVTGGYLVTPDYTKYDYGVSMNDIVKIVQESRCKNKIVVLDCCHSGEIAKINLSGQNASIIGEGVTLLTASRGEETSAESNGHGVFTSLLLEALSGSAADITGHITPASIYAYIDKALGAWEQRPVFKTNTTQFISLRKTRPQVDIDIIRKIGLYFSEENAIFKLDPSFEPTNTNSVVHEIIEPYADAAHTQVFSDLQELESIGLVVPNGEKHMYYAAMKSKSCKLTALGKQFWRLVKKGKI